MNIDKLRKQWERVTSADEKDFMRRELELEAEENQYSPRARGWRGLLV